MFTLAQEKPKIYTCMVHGQFSLDFAISQMLTWFAKFEFTKISLILILEYSNNYDYSNNYIINLYLANLCIKTYWWLISQRIHACAFTTIKFMNLNQSEIHEI